MDSDDVTQRIFSRLRHSKMKKEFATLDPKQLSRLSDKDLADWHASQQPDSPQNILAANEWQRRITVRQIRAGYLTALLSGLMGLGGVALGWWLSQASKQQSQQSPKAQAQSALTQPVGPPKPTPGSPPIQPVVPPKAP